MSKRPARNSASAVLSRSNSASTALAGSAGERRVDLETFEPEFLGVIAVKSVGAGVEAALVEHGDDADFEPGGLGFAEPLGPDRRVGLGAAFEKFAMEIGEVHRRAKGSAEHRAQHLIPRGRVADEIRLEVMREASSARGGGFVHDSPSLHKPRRAHDHRLAALPVDFAFLDAFVFDVIEELPGEQRHEEHGQPMRFLVLEAIGAGHVALRRGEKDDAEDAVAHGAEAVSWLARSRPISSAAASSVAKSCFTPAQAYVGSGHLK